MAEDRRKLSGNEAMLANFEVSSLFLIEQHREIQKEHFVSLGFFFSGALCVLGIIIHELTKDLFPTPIKMTQYNEF